MNIYLYLVSYRGDKSFKIYLLVLKLGKGYWAIYSKSGKVNNILS